MLSARWVCFGLRNKYLGGLQWKYPHFSSRLGSGCPVAQRCREIPKQRGALSTYPSSDAPQRIELEWFRARKAAAWQKLLQRADTAQWEQKGRFFPGSQRIPCKICCKPGEHRKVDGVRLNVKARICPARTMKFVTSPFHRSLSFCSFSDLISSWY